MSKKRKLLLLFLIVAITGNAQNRRQKSEYIKYNPAYHFYPSGDPTGLFYLGGRYYDNWGSAYSDDLVHWRYRASSAQILRARLADSGISKQLRDSLMAKIPRLGGSGSVVVDWNNSSGFGKNGVPPLISLWHNDSRPWGNQIVGLAYSNDTAKTWTRYGKFPVLDINNREFRDPKVFWYEPTKSWIMAIGLAEAPKVKFFSSTNLKDWTFMSEFGPWGAVGGVWECADFFPLAVDGDPAHIKWVLVVSVQPLSGQYFIGDFDGRRFTLDSTFVRQLSVDKYMPQGDVLFDFEHGMDGWQTEGDAFSESPSNQALLGQGAAMGYFGRFYLNSFHDRGQSSGKQTSPPFRITKAFINFLAGGNYDPGNLAINLLVDGKIVRTQTGNNSGGMQWYSWDVTEFLGKSAEIEAVDNGPGAILADQFMLCDEPARQEREKAFWIDYGADFYAVRSWNNYPANEARRIWSGWMGSWRYAGVEPVRGFQTIPRTVELKTFPEGIRLVQSPIKELESLRGTEKDGGEVTFEGLWKAEKIRPAKNNYELIAEIENVSAEEFGIKLAAGNHQQTVVGYSVINEQLYVDRRRSGLADFSGLFPQCNHGPLKNRNSTLKLRIFVDNSSVEVFANDGETVISSKIYPDPGSTGIEFFSTKGTIHIKSVRLWELRPIGLEKTMPVSGGVKTSKQ
ncbi:MAG TPA: GH32 C-terminal domain-containing protein [Puia sp.]|nr:GH32 C-terminal domain-containing protein [Puia sp.]